MANRTCEKCQSIPRYTVQQEGAKPKWYACWAHLPRLLDELLQDRSFSVVVKRHG